MATYIETAMSLAKTARWKVEVRPDGFAGQPASVIIKCGDLYMSTDAENAAELRDALIAAIGPGERIPDAVTTNVAAE